MEEVLTQAFWIGLAKIIGVNIVLSGDNAVVIALAARSLPPAQQEKAIFWGSAAAIILRVILTIFAVKLLALPWLKLIGAVLLLYIGIKLLLPEDGGDNIDSSDNLMAAIKTILVADFVMSVDNVIAVAAAAGGSITLLILGLAISIPLIIIGATMLLKLMERWPVIITIGAGLLGFVAGEMAITDPAIGEWVKSTFEHINGTPRIFSVNLEILCGIVGAIVVVVAGVQLAKRKDVNTPENQTAH
ncbi:MAG: TerC family protein [Betaproteobacteria bacterium]|nr:TerC family protein [Betaproteobacteria bacterium]